MQAARLEAHVEQMFDGLDDANGADDVPFDELVGMQGPVFHLVENAITVLASNAIFLGVPSIVYCDALNGDGSIPHYARGEPFTFGRLYGISSFTEAIPSLARQFLAGMRHLATTVKVAFLLVIELGVFPLMCGWWLDICTIRMLGTTIAQRVEFFSISPVASSLIHWLVGIMYMLQISIFVSLLHGVLRNVVYIF